LLTRSVDAKSRRWYRSGQAVLRKGLLLSALAALALGIALTFGVLLFDWQTIRRHVMPAAQTANASTQPATSSRGLNAVVHVKVARVRVQDVPIYLSGIGTVQAYNTVNITTRVDGQITQILFKEGQDVKPGDVLAIVDPRPYQAQLEQQEATLLKDRALLNEAVADLQRYEALEKTTAVSEQQVDDQRYLVDQDRAQVKLDEAQVAYAKTQVDYTTIRSPIEGRVGIRQVDQGNIVYAALNTTIVVLTQLRPISVIFTLPAKDVAAAKLAPGLANAPVIAYAADDTTELDRGTIDLVDNEIDATTGTIKLKASFPNEALHLWPGDFINGRIVVETRHNGLTVPPIALRHGPRGDYVWIVNDDDTVHAQGVRVRQTADRRVLIDRNRNIRRGQRVVIEGHFLLENGKHVEIEESEPPAAAATPQAERRTKADAD
jgi:membrane fusion protein, multidrug efflux system